MSFSGSSGVGDVMCFSTFAATAIGDTVIAVTGVDKKLDAGSGVRPIGNTNKPTMAGRIIVIVNAIIAVVKPPLRPA
jgi:hypothetical protein